MRLVIEVQGETERRLVISAVKHGMTPEATAVKAIRDLYWIIDKLTDAQRRELLARAAVGGAGSFES